MNLQEIVDVRLLQKVQDTFAQATGFAAVTVDFRGTPITEYSNFSPFCTLVRKDPHLLEGCLKCDAYGGLEAARKEMPYIYRCHTGLMDFAVPIIVKGQLMGSMLVGQVKLRESDITKIASITNTPSVWEEKEGLTSEYGKIPVISYKKIRAAAEMMFYVITNMFEKDIMHYVQEELHAKNQQIIDQLNIQADLEKALAEQQSQPMMMRDFLLNAMNTLTCLAIIEGAPETEKAVLLFTEMMDHSMDVQNGLVTLKEEMSHLDTYLNFQKIRFRDRVQVRVHIMREYESLLLPPSILQLIVDYALDQSMKVKCESGFISVTGYAAGKDFMLEISLENFNGRVISTGTLEQNKFLHIHSILSAHYNENYTIAVTDNLSENSITLRIPTEWKEEANHAYHPLSR